ncbi:TIM barrel protein [Oceanirhabdus sp. W0125-5]|uniref:TIM barrel protein n=1 Tax=Oceanirhabdus sp. W0125-5 TaxID=2999116 RepID=UPI0022F307C9|nr:TIM barrel protein [Oceanirhabdus sp. W0125-5]WBW95586.1 TIM barrel protein [Oceanirhabdus sp. W0125-5]
MAHKLGVSGSVILSNPELYTELFWEGIEHIEIGEFYDENALNHLIKECKDKQVSLGIHSPLMRSGSKYDLIERVQYDPQFAWEQIEDEAKRMSSIGAEYLLVHFPYFKGEIAGNPNELIEEGLRKLSNIQKKYCIDIICEPKLGFNRSPAGIKYLHNFPMEIWEKYNIKVCIDIGDYLIATNEDVFDYLIKWIKFVKVVHLHNIYYQGNKYIWTPVHPTQKYEISNNKIEKIIRFFSQCEDVSFVFEHTPHTNPSKELVHEGYKWVKSLISA